MGKLDFLCVPKHEGLVMAKRQIEQEKNIPDIDIEFDDLDEILDNKIKEFTDDNGDFDIWTVVEHLEGVEGLTSKHWMNIYDTQEDRI